MDAIIKHIIFQSSTAAFTISITYKIPMNALNICDENMSPTLVPTFFVPKISVTTVGKMEKFEESKPNSKQTQINGIAFPTQYGHKNNNTDKHKLLFLS